MTTKKETATIAAYEAARAYYERTAEAEAAWTYAYDAAKAAGSRQIKTDANAAIARLADEIHHAGPAAHTAYAKAAYTAAREAYEADPTEATKFAEAIANHRLESAYREQAEACSPLGVAAAEERAEQAEADDIASLAEQEAAAYAAYQAARAAEQATPSADEPDGPDTTANPNDYATTGHTVDVWLSPIGSQIRGHADNADEAEEIAFEHAAENGWDYDPERDADDVTIRHITPRPASPDEDGPESPEADAANAARRATPPTAPAPKASRPHGGENDHTAIRAACAAYEAGEQDGPDPYTPDEEAYNDAIEAAIETGLDPSRADALAVAVTCYAQQRNTGSTIDEATQSAIEAYHDTEDDALDWTPAADNDLNGNRERAWAVYRAAAHAEQAARDYGHSPADIGYPVYHAAINAGAYPHEARTIAAYAEARACSYPGHRTTAADAADTAYTNCRQANHTPATAHALAQLAATQNGSSPHAAPYHADQAASDYAANAYNAGQARPEGTRVCATPRTRTAGTPEEAEEASPSPAARDAYRLAREAGQSPEEAISHAIAALTAERTTTPIGRLMAIPGAAETYGSYPHGPTPPSADADALTQAEQAEAAAREKHEEQIRLHPHPLQITRRLARIAYERAHQAAEELRRAQADA